MSAAPKTARGGGGSPSGTFAVIRPEIADEWARNAPELASWTDAHLVNRRDAFGHYIAVERRKTTDDSATTDKSRLTIEVLERHYRAESTGDIIGLHSTAIDDATGEGEVPACWSRWGALDIDRHREHEDPAANFKAVLAWHDCVRKLGFHPLLVDSNGTGGYHLRLIFNTPVPTPDVFNFMGWLRRDWESFGLAEAPETFPKQPRLPKGRNYGNWLRLPGRHHTRHHWSRVWNGSNWVDGNAAIGFILAMTGDSPSLIPREAITASPFAGPARNSSRMRAVASSRRSDEDLAQEALGYLGGMIDNYHSWLEVGMSLTPLGNVGLILWDNWSRGAPSKYQPGACQEKWASFGRDGRTLGTLFKHARDAGWPGPGGTKGQPSNGHTTTNGDHPPGEQPGTPPDDGPEPWQEPATGATPRAEPFPTDALPLPLADLITVGAASSNCSPDYLAVAALVVGSVAIGRSVALSLKKKWDISPVIYAALVGDPGSTKSPAIKLMAEPLGEISGDLLKSYREDRKRNEAAAKAEKSKERKENDSPPLRRIVVDDATVESLAPLLQENPRGLVMIRDELTAWVAGQNQYKSGGKGSDRQFFLSTWSGSPVTVDRKSNPDRIPIHIPRPFISVVGGLTISMLSELSETKGRDDGFIDRLLFTVPEPVDVEWSHDEIPDDLINEWNRAVRMLWNVPMTTDEDGTQRPWFVRFEPPAMAAYIAWHDDHCREARELDFPGYLKGPWQKFRDYCARLALIIDRLDWAYDPTETTQHRDVSKRSVLSAIRLVEYFKSHSRRAHALIRGSGGHDNEEARAILKWIKTGRRSTFSERDAKQNFRARFSGDGPELGNAIAWLRGRHCIRSTPAEKKRGRSHSPVYEVNPALLE